MSKVWRSLRQQAEQFAGWNPVMRWNVEYRVLEHDCFEAALGANLGFSLRHLGGDKLLAEAISGQQQGRFDLFAQVPHITFPGGKHLRSPLLALGMLWHRLKELL